MISLGVPGALPVEREKRDCVRSQIKSPLGRIMKNRWTLR